MVRGRRAFVRVIPRVLLRAGMHRPMFTRMLSNDARIAAWNRLGSRIAESCVVGHHVSVHHGSVDVGPETVLNGRVEIAAWGPVTIGANVMVSPDCRFLSASHDVDSPAFDGVIEPITVSDNVWLATGAVVLPGVTIGEGAVVGAFSVVASDVAARTVVAGNPARVVKERAKFEPSVTFAEIKRRQPR